MVIIFSVAIFQIVKLLTPNCMIAKIARTVSSILNAYENISGIKLQMEQIQRLWLSIACFACVVKQTNALTAMGCFCIATKRMEFPNVQSALGEDTQKHVLYNVTITECFAILATSNRCKIFRIR